MKSGNDVILGIMNHMLTDESILYIINLSWHKETFFEYESYAGIWNYTAQYEPYVNILIRTAQYKS